MKDYLLILKEYHILLCKAKAKPSPKKTRHEVTSERSKANRSKTAARSQNQQDRPLFFCVKKSGGL